MANRPSKPLFELLREDVNTGRRAPARPVPPPAEVKPVRPAPAPEPMSSSGPVESEAEPMVVGGGTLVISSYAVYIAVAVVLAAIFLVWAIAYKTGRDRGQQEISRYVESNPPSAVRPTEPPASVQPPVSKDSGKQAPAPKTNPPPTKPAPVPAPAAPADDPNKPVITAAGNLDKDPRIPGLNYLVLATRYPRDEARELVLFLSKNGLETVGVPMKLDSGGASANNPGSYKVVVRTGVSREQFATNDPAKTAAKDAAQRIGPLWKASKTGRSDLSSSYWEKLEP